MTHYPRRPQDCTHPRLVHADGVMRCTACGTEMAHHPSVEGAIAAMRRVLSEQRPPLRLARNQEVADDDR